MRTILHGAAVICRDPVFRFVGAVIAATLAWGAASFAVGRLIGDAAGWIWFGGSALVIVGWVLHSVGKDSDGVS